MNITAINPIQLKKELDTHKLVMLQYLQIRIIAKDWIGAIKVLSEIIKIDAEIEVWNKIINV